METELMGTKSHLSSPSLKYLNRLSLVGHADTSIKITTRRPSIQLKLYYLELRSNPHLLHVHYDVRITCLLGWDKMNLEHSRCHHCSNQEGMLFLHHNGHATSGDY